MPVSNELTIRVPNDLKHRIKLEAERQGVTVSELAVYFFASEIGMIDGIRKVSGSWNEQPSLILNSNFENELVMPDTLQEPDIEKQNFFTQEVQKLYLIAGYSIQGVPGSTSSLLIDQKNYGVINQNKIICKDCHIDLNKCDSLIDKKNNDQHHSMIVVSSRGFDIDALSLLEKNNISCLTYKELFYELFPIEQYIHQQILNYEKKIAEKWDGKNCFIPPEIETDITLESYPAITYFDQWIQDSKCPFLVIFGNLGTGKTCLSEFLTYKLSRNFLENPVKYPFPVFISLKEMTQDLSLEDIVSSHFSRNGVEKIDYVRFDQLLISGKIVLFFDAFDEMTDRSGWRISQNKYKELRKASKNGGKVVLTCRTHFFKDRNEQSKFFNKPANPSDFEESLACDQTDEGISEIVYLREVNEDQVIEYLNKIRPETAMNDIEKIKQIYNLSELTLCPLFLEIIRKNLNTINDSSEITAAKLYAALTKSWIERLKSKRWFLDAKIKREIMLRMAWEIWNSETKRIHYKEFLPFLMPFAKAQKWTENNLRLIIRELMAASFLKRDDQGHFSFMHQSIMEFFIAKRLHIAFKSNKAIRKLLNTYRLNKKIILFLTLMDKEKNIITKTLQTILNAGYEKNISENTLQILYWSARYACDMPESVTDVKKVQEKTRHLIPENAKLSNALLQEINLEAADLQKADLQNADLSKANLKNALIQNANLDNAILDGTILDNSEPEDNNNSNDITVEAIYDELVEDDLADDIEFDDIDFDLENQSEDLDDEEFDEKQTDETIQDETIQDETIQDETQLEEALTEKHIPTKTDLRPVIQTGHNYSVCSVCYHPKLNLLASSDSGGGILIFDLKNKKLLFQLDRHPLSVNCVSFSPDGKHLVSGSIDRTVSVWDVKNGTPVHLLEGHDGAVYSVAFSPDNQTIASTSDDLTIHLWDVKDGIAKQALKGHKSAVVSVAFSPDGQYLASGSYDKSVRLWDSQSGEEVRVFEGHHRYVSSVTFSPDGEIIASGSDDQTVRMWNPQNGKTIHSFHGHSKTVTSVDFSSNGQSLASGSSDKTIRLWDVKNFQPVSVLKGHQNDINSVTFLSNNKTLASGGEDQTIYFWNLKQSDPIHSIQKLDNTINTIAFSPDGKALANGSSDHSICLWDIKHGKPHALMGHQEEITSIHYSPDNLFMASGSVDQTVRIWDVKNDATVHVLYGHSQTVNSVAFAPDGQTLASGSNDQMVRLWDIQKGYGIKVLKGHSNTVTSVKYSPDGQLLASGSFDKTVRVWNIKKAKTINVLKGHSKSVISVDFSPDGKYLASASYDHNVNVWNVKKAKTIHVLKGHTHSVVSVVFSPDGKYIASGGYDQTVRLWDVKTGQCRNVLAGHWGGVYSVQFSKNGKYLVAAGTGGRLQFWDPFLGKTFLHRYLFGPEEWLDLMPEGRFNGSTEALKYLRYTEIERLNSYPAEDMLEDFYKPDDVKALLRMYNELK
ncbi:repeat-containing protein [Candidatus Magnetomorum sp. HK-1]|nr:repeat-containing protein [Candidatus Magnetomorum sp. HK-1]